MFTPFRETAQKWREKESKRRWRSRWTAHFDAEDRTDDDVYNARLKTAWRITRAHALCKGQIIPEERLAAIPEEQWYDKVPDASPSNRSLTAQLVADNFSGLSLLPDKYNYQIYTSAFFRTAKDLHIQDWDLIGFDEHAYPNREEIIRFEHEFIHSLISEFFYGGHYHLKKRISDLGLTEAELAGTILLVKSEATTDISFDLENDRRMMVARLEDYIRRSQDAADLRAEMQGIKALTVIQGINKVEPEDTITLVATIAKDLAHAEREQSKLLLGSNESGNTGRSDNRQPERVVEDAG